MTDVDQPNEPADGGAEAETGADDPNTLHVDMGAALDVDEDAVAAAAKTSLDMDGFETGAGFDLGDVPENTGLEAEVEALDVESTLVVEEPWQAAASSATGGSGDSGAGGLVLDTSMPEAEAPEVDRSTEDDWEAGPAEPVLDQTAIGSEWKDRVRGEAGRSHGLKRIVLAIIGIGGLGLTLGYWGVVTIPGVTPADRVRFTVPAPVELPGPQPDSPVMSHVLFVDQWREEQTPLAWAAALQERTPDLLGFVTPVLNEDDTRYALLVGPAYSAAEATGLREPLAVAFGALKTNPQTWTVEEAPYSFYLGEYVTVSLARARVAELAGLSIPAFVLRVTYPSGDQAHRVYAGAFSDESQAVGMGRLLNQNALGDAPLTARRGRLPS